MSAKAPMGDDQKAMRAFLYSLIDWSGPANVLELGCGDGYDLQEMAKLAAPGSFFVGMDVSRAKIEQAEDGSRWPCTLIKDGKSFSWHAQAAAQIENKCS